jgi:hypothetical protein
METCGIYDVNVPARFLSHLNIGDHWVIFKYNTIIMLITLLETRHVSSHRKSLLRAQIYDVGFQTSYTKLRGYQPCVPAIDHSQHATLHAYNNTV